MWTYPQVYCRFLFNNDFAALSSQLDAFKSDTVTVISQLWNTNSR